MMRTKEVDDQIDSILKEFKNCIKKKKKQCKRRKPKTNK